MGEERLERIPVAVLGATGSVGQRFVQLLDGHPWFKVVALTGSERRVGQVYGESCRWILPEAMPAWAMGMTLQPSAPDAVDVPLVFSALPSGVAKTVEPRFASAGAAVCTNAGAFRREVDVPILLPEINPDHIRVLASQRERTGWKGFIVTNPNCTSTGVAVALKALDDCFGVEKAFLISLQALSGAGYPGVSSMDVLDNVLPYIAGEEQKMEWEPRKILGSLVDGEIALAGFRLSAHANRVAVSDGHLVCLSVAFKNHPGENELLDTARAALRDFLAPPPSRDLPSAPNPVILVRGEADRPQPRLDRSTGGGMTTVVGRLRPDPLYHLKLVVLSHNTVRGAAGGSVYNAELLVKEGYIPA